MGADLEECWFGVLHDLARQRPRSYALDNFARRGIQRPDSTGGGACDDTARGRTQTTHGPDRNRGRMRGVSRRSPNDLFERGRKLGTRAENRARMAAVKAGFAPGERFERRLFWILGSPRSGSTWLLQMLAALPRVIALDEPLIGAHLGNIIADQRGTRIEDLNASNFTFLRQRHQVRQQFFSDEARELWEPWLGRFIRARFFAHAIATVPTARPNGSLIAIKEPNGSQAADILLRVLPNSRALLLLRDGRDVIDSELAAVAKGSWLSREFSGVESVEGTARTEFLVRSALKWLWRTEVVQEALSRHPGPTLTMRYEDLRAEPFKWMRQLCDWLELAVDDDLLRDTIAGAAFESIPAEAKGEGEFFRAAQPGLWEKNFSAEERDAVEAVIGDKLREFGYRV